MSDTLKAVQNLARHGKPVFPCDPENKRPLTPHGFKDATTDPRQIAAWWRKHPTAMIGLPTGQPSGLWAVDCDGSVGVDGFVSLCAVHSYTPNTLTQDTPSGGCHYLFTVPGGERIPNSAGKLAPHVDVRGDGGYIIVAPSQRTDGRHYAWRKNTPRPVAAPEWLVKLATSSNPRAQTPPPARAGGNLVLRS